MTAEQTKRRRTRANGEGAVWHDTARKRWVGTVTTGYDSEGKQVRRSVTGPTKRVVLERLRELSNAVDSGQTPAPRDFTVRRFLEQWLADVLPGTVAATTEVQYGNIVRLYIIPEIGQVRLRSLQAKDVSRMLQKLAASGKSPNTQRLARSVLRRALRSAEREGVVPRNVAALADGVKLGRPDNAGKALTPDQARRLLDHVRGDRYEAAFVVGLALGMRRGEILALAWDDLDLDGAPPRLTVTRNLVRLPGMGLRLQDTKTSGSRRTIQMPAQVVDVLRRHRLDQLQERLVVGPEWPEKPLGADLVFRAPFGTPADPDNFRNHTYRVTEAAGIGRRSPHQLRHSAASLLIAQGVPMKIVSETLGHSSIRITADVYGHLFDEAGAIAADAMTAALWGAEG